ncbi:hypothetical protein L596_019338 [Steinernema carpocapsae]|uniref:Saposin B-type domain-containing protein n=1 Tax=Steinernema carpocapsae TaxID=34508 RepID=A0A4U5MQE7_STECR|nr:hypothetical protein L596_019338 [Steinernema carpocapsae]
MKLLLFVALSGLFALASTRAVKEQVINDCKWCTHMMRREADRFGNYENELDLLKQLERACLQLVRHYNSDTARYCSRKVNDNITPIWNAFKNYQSAKHICQAYMGECESATPGWRTERTPDYTWATGTPGYPYGTGIPGWNSESTVGYPWATGTPGYGYGTGTPGYPFGTETPYY